MAEKGSVQFIGGDDSPPKQINLAVDYGLFVPGLDTHCDLARKEWLL